MSKDADWAFKVEELEHSMVESVRSAAREAKMEYLNSGKITSLYGILRLSVKLKREMEKKLSG